LHSADAAELGLVEGDAAQIEVADISAQVEVRLCDTMARGFVLAPRLQGSALMRLAPGEPVACRLVKGGGA
ncbi:MAG: hypothetical protein GWO11_03350, partial [Desulfuromonadales bacterium]|nr:hypothetical protein [Desulfuromonadales bacterium]NIR33494.1 hypothetical protein [Desulfuromonadales bacterium]NIS39667.1 hypothetical protein [Desulfuromonadales bacterium]